MATMAPSWRRCPAATPEASEAESLQAAAPSAAPPVPAPACARLPRALAAVMAAGAVGCVLWSVRAQQEGSLASRPMGVPVSVAQETWIKKIDTVCSNFDDIKLGEAILDSGEENCIVLCQKNSQCAFVSHVAGADWKGEGTVGAGVCFLLGTGCKEESNAADSGWSLYYRKGGGAGTPHAASSVMGQAAPSPAGQTSKPASPSQAAFKGAWESWPSTGCTNWEAIKLGDVKIMKGGLKECQEACGLRDICYAVNYQPRDCNKGEPGNKKGACYLYGKPSSGAGCQQGRNTCWELHIKSP